MIEIKSKNISKLDLSNLGLTEIPKEIFKLKNLKSLNLSNNLIKTIPKEIEQLKRLETLDLSNNKISNFYAKICELNKVKHLNLNNNKISSLPKQIKKLSFLRKLSISNNQISSFPAEFSELINLISLNISKNPIKKFPDEILSLEQLKRLWLSNLELETFPASEILECLKNLNSIYAYGELITKKNIDPTFFILQKIKGNCFYKLISIQNQEKYLITNSTNIKSNISKIFISYSHSDKIWLEKVQKNLKVLNYSNDNFDVWDDTKIRAGKEWKREIETALEESNIALLLISTDFLASDFIQNNELPIILENAKNKGTAILSLIVGHSRFSKHPILSNFQAVNDPSKPLKECSESEQEKFLVKMTDDIESYTNEI